ncbi:hypothetical protein [uncultured Parolsenella sp.]|uniref:hypothetical protein n=1 Tax=uncultured Parolsenella sp. TaxID=2083008 RepID=UPI0027D99130|nr:hypothetical protein [uncultured Parolsenella sp.]
MTAKARLEALGMWEGHAVKEGRRYLIDDKAVSAFSEHYQPRERPARSTQGARDGAETAAPSCPSAETGELIAELRDMVAYLKDRLAEKDDLAAKQLAEKDEQIARRDDQISQLISR